MITKLVKDYGETAQLDICMEECAELIHACSKYKRSKGIGYKTWDNEAISYQNLLEQIAHCVNAIRGVMILEQIKGKDLMQEIYFSDIKSLGRLFTEEEKMRWAVENKGIVHLSLKEGEQNETI